TTESESWSMGTSVNEKGHASQSVGHSKGRSTSYTEQDIKLYRQEQGSPTRTYSDMAKEIATKLAGLENYAAYVAIGSRGDRFKHLMKIDNLPTASAGLLAERRKQALKIAEQYTTAITEIEQQEKKRR